MGRAVFARHVAQHRQSRFGGNRTEADKQVVVEECGHEKER